MRHRDTKPRPVLCSAATPPSRGCDRQRASQLTHACVCLLACVRACAPPGTITGNALFWSEIERFHIERQVAITDVVGQLAVGSIQFEQRLSSMWSNALAAQQINYDEQLAKAKLAYARIGATTSTDPGSPSGIFESGFSGGRDRGFSAASSVGARDRGISAASSVGKAAAEGGVGRTSPPPAPQGDPLLGRGAAAAPEPRWSEGSEAGV